MVLSLYLIYLYCANSSISGYPRSYSAGTGRVNKVLPCLPQSLVFVADCISKRRRKKDEVNCIWCWFKNHRNFTPPFSNNVALILRRKTEIFVLVVSTPGVVKWKYIAVPSSLAILFSFVSALLIFILLSPLCPGECGFVM